MFYGCFKTVKGYTRQYTVAAGRQKHGKQGFLTFQSITKMKHYTQEMNVRATALTLESE